MIVALLVSYSRPWLKLLGVSAIVLVSVALVAEKDRLVQMISQGAHLNRVADTISAVYRRQYSIHRIGHLSIQARSVPTCPRSPWS